MYGIEFKEGKPHKIVPNPSKDIIGIIVDVLPIALEEMIGTNTVQEMTDENNKIYYIIGGNK